MLTKLLNRFTALTDESRIQLEGQKDGERNIPEMGSYTPAQFELALVANGERRVQRVFEKASVLIAKLLPGFQAYEKHFQDMDARFQMIVERNKARKQKLGRDVAAPFPYKYHLLLIVFLAIGEFPLNTIVFRLFGEPEYLTYVMASTLALTIPLLGLFIGIHVRQSIPRTAGNILIGLVIPAAVGAALFAISMLRNTYIVAAQVSTSGAVAGNPDHLAYSLFALNTLVFCGAMVSAFFAHDPDEDLDHSWNALVRLDGKRNAIRKKLLQIGTRINGEIKKVKSQIEQIRAMSRERIALYRQTNMRFRRLSAPLSFRKDPEFMQLEWWPEVSVDGGRSGT